MISTTTSEITGCTHDRPDKIYLDEHVTDYAHVNFTEYWHATFASAYLISYIELLSDLTVWWKWWRQTSSLFSVLSSSSTVFNIFTLIFENRAVENVLQM